MSLSGIAQFFIGFIVGISLLIGGSAATGYYFFSKMAVIPPKPLFPEEKPKESQTANQGSSQTASQPESNNQPQANSSAAPEPKLEPGAYKARVTWPEGLSLRDQPSLNSNRIGGVAYNQEIIILRDSDDKRWQRIRMQDSQQEGWVKAGNVRRVDS